MKLVTIHFNISLSETKRVLIIETIKEGPQFTLMAREATLTFEEFNSIILSVSDIIMLN